MSDSKPTRNLALELARVTEAAALASGRYMGRGDKIAADRAAVDAMRLMLNTIRMNGVIVIGEGEKDKAPMLFQRRAVGYRRFARCGHRSRPNRWHSPVCHGYAERHCYGSARAAWLDV
jgi:hypothetical protein